MTTTLEGLKTLIHNKISSLTIGGDSIFGHISKFPTGNFDGYPAAVIIPKGSEGTWLDSARNERTYRFTINLYQEQTKAGRSQEEADSVMGNSIDAIVTAFDKDKDLGGEVQIIRVVSMEYDFKVANDTYIYASINIDCVVIVPNYQ